MTLQSAAIGVFARRAAVPAAWLLAGAALVAAGRANDYVLLTLMYLGINVILTLSLNLVNGYMGEFSVGHAAFMALGAYGSSVLTVEVFPAGWGPWIFPVAVVLGGVTAAVAGMCVAVPSFRIRGDYLAIVTLAFNMIVKSVLENLEVVGGPRGMMGMDRLTTPLNVLFWMLACVWLVRRFVYSRFGRAAAAIREDELAASLMGVDTRRVKLLTFTLSAFFAGVAGALAAHLLQFINPRMFDILKSTDILVMMYLGGVGSITGSVIGAAIYTVLLELLRPLGFWRMVFMPLMLVLLMLYRPRGLFGYREVGWLIPRRERENRGA